MQIIKPSLGLSTSPLGVIKNSPISNRFLLGKEPKIQSCYKNNIQSLETRLGLRFYFKSPLVKPLVDYSKFLQPRQEKLIVDETVWNSENWNINEFTQFSSYEELEENLESDPVLQQEERHNYSEDDVENNFTTIITDLLPVTDPTHFDSKDEREGASITQIATQIEEECESEQSPFIQNQFKTKSKSKNISKTKSKSQKNIGKTRNKIAKNIEAGESNKIQFASSERTEDFSEKQNLRELDNALQENKSIPIQSEIQSSLKEILIQEPISSPEQIVFLQEIETTELDNTTLSDRERVESDAIALENYSLTQETTNLPAERNIEVPSKQENLIISKASSQIIPEQLDRVLEKESIHSQQIDSEPNLEANLSPLLPTVIKENQDILPCESFNTIIPQVAQENPEIHHSLNHLLQDVKLNEENSESANIATRSSESQEINSAEIRQTNLYPEVLADDNLDISASQTLLEQDNIIQLREVDNTEIIDNIAGKPLEVKKSEDSDRSLHIQPEILPEYIQAETKNLGGEHLLNIQEENLPECRQAEIKNLEDKQHLLVLQKEEVIENIQTEIKNLEDNQHLLVLQKEEVTEDIPTKINNLEDSDSFHIQEEETLQEHIKTDFLTSNLVEDNLLETQNVENTPNSDEVSPKDNFVDFLNNISDNLPAPTGYATGGLVIQTNISDDPPIAPSDTVPAMLTPGEFVINAKDAQKNINILHHINRGGTLPEDINTSISSDVEPRVAKNIEVERHSSNPTSDRIDNVQNKSNIISPKFISTSLTSLENSNTKNLGVIAYQPLQFNLFDDSNQNLTSENRTTNNTLNSYYTSPNLIFRKASTNNTVTDKNFNMGLPTQWESVEELLSGNTDELTTFNFSPVRYNQSNLDNSTNLQAPQIPTRRLPATQSFADGREVTQSDIATDIAPVTTTIKSFADTTNNSNASQEESNDKTSLDMEALAHEIYRRLRQRIEIERERYGMYSGRLPW